MSIKLTQSQTKDVQALNHGMFSTGQIIYIFFSLNFFFSPKTNNGKGQKCPSEIVFFMIRWFSLCSNASKQGIKGGVLTFAHDWQLKTSLFYGFQLTDQRHFHFRRFDHIFSKTSSRRKKEKLNTLLPINVTAAERVAVMSDRAPWSFSSESYNIGSIRSDLFYICV